MKKPTKKYILWVYNGNAGYSPTEYDKIEDAVIENKNTDDWYVTEAINDISAYASFKEEKIKKS